MTAWTVRDVLNHITGGAEMFALCVRDGSVPDEKLGELMTGDNLGNDYKGRVPPRPPTPPTRRSRSPGRWSEW